MAVHRTSKAVRFHELDPYDHVNHAIYVTWLEIARVEALDAIGLGLHELKARGLQFVVTKLDIRYRRAASAGDVAEIETAISTFGRASTVWTQRILRGDEVLVTAEVTVAVTDATGRPTRPPAGMFDTLRTLAADAA